MTRSFINYSSEIIRRKFRVRGRKIVLKLINSPFFLPNKLGGEHRCVKKTSPNFFYQSLIGLYKPAVLKIVKQQRIFIIIGSKNIHLSFIYPSGSHNEYKFPKQNSTHLKIGGQNNFSSNVISLSFFSHELIILQPRLNPRD